MTIWDWKGGGREKRIQEDGLSNGYRGSPTPRVRLGKSATSGKHSPGPWPSGMRVYWHALNSSTSKRHWLMTSQEHACQCVSVQGSVTLLPRSKDHLLPVLVQCRGWEGRIMHRNSSPVRLFLFSVTIGPFVLRGIVSPFQQILGEAGHSIPEKLFYRV